MQRMLTAAAIVAGVALSTTGLALAQSSTTSPSTAAPTMTPSTGTTNPAATSGASGLNNPANGPSAANNPASTGAQSLEQIKQAQQQLKEQGLYKGAIDGQMGPETKAALSQFQQQNGLPQNAELDQNTLGRLNGNGAATTGNSGSSTPPSTMNPSMVPAHPGTGSSYAAPGAGSNGAAGGASPGMGGAGTGTGTTAH